MRSGQERCNESYYGSCQLTAGWLEQKRLTLSLGIEVIAFSSLCISHPNKEGGGRRV